MIAKQIKESNERLLNLALEECLERQLFSATEFVDMVRYLNRQRDVQEYVSVLEGRFIMNQLKILQETLKSLRLGETAEQLPVLLEKAEKEEDAYAGFLMNVMSY